MKSDGRALGPSALQFADLARSMFAAADTGSVLGVTVSAAIDLIEGADLASVTLRADGDPPDFRTAVASDPVAGRIDALQYSTAEGPAVLVAGGSVLSVSAVDIARDERWPAFGPAVADEGVKAVLSVGLLRPAGESEQSPPPLGALNLYARSANSFSGVDYDTALVLAAHAGSALAALAERDAAHEHVARLASDSAVRDVVGQAKGMLMERHGLPEPQVLAVLTEAAGRLQMPLADLASSIVQNPSAPSPAELRIEEYEPGDEQLRRIEAVTDTALSRLDVEDLLLELMDRVKDALQVDTAAVLLLDPGSDQLVATAARGIEEEVRQGVRVPLGAGFAGRIAEERRPVLLEEVSELNTVNPLLRRKGIRSMLGVPLIAAGRMVGVMHVGTTTSRRFSDSDADFLQRAGDRVALAVSSQVSGVERSAARLLARSLIPARLPSVPGLELASRYIPGEEGGVGGDWYDVFRLPTGRFGVVIGDVTGHGLSAAVVMGRLRSALRAYALQDDDPARVLQELDHKIQHFEPGAMATVCYVVFEPDLESVQVSLAGHLPPMMAAPHQPAEIPDIPVDLMLGVRLGIERRSTTLQLAPGELMCLYTDGLIERRGSDIDADMQRLRDRLVAGPPEWICQSVTAALIGPAELTDDVAMLVIRRQA